MYNVYNLMSWIYAYACKSITTIKVINTSITSKCFLLLSTPPLLFLNKFQRSVVQHSVQLTDLYCAIKNECLREQISCYDSLLASSHLIADHLFILTLQLLPNLFCFPCHDRLVVYIEIDALSLPPHALLLNDILSYVPSFNFPFPHGSGIYDTDIQYPQITLSFLFYHVSPSGPSFSKCYYFHYVAPSLPPSSVSQVTASSYNIVQ